MRGLPSYSRSVRRALPLVTVGLLALLAVGAAVLAAVQSPNRAKQGSSSHLSGRPAPPHPGWRWIRYQSALVAVPPSWVVEHGIPCPSPHHGTLELGATRGVYHCPGYGATANLVHLQPLRVSTARYTDGLARIVNGVALCHVIAGSVTSDAWDVPGLGVEISATGPTATSVVATLRAVSPAARRRTASRGWGLHIVGTVTAARRRQPGSASLVSPAVG